MPPVSTATMNAPRGPHGGGRNRSGLSRGGIQKRSTPAVRMDRDGDLDMSVSGPNSSNSRSRGLRTASSRSRSDTARGPAGSTTRSAGKQIQDALRNNTNDQINLHTHASRRPNSHRSGFAQVAVRGWQTSKAASNEDGGRASVIEFIQRKAKTNGPSLRILKSHVHGDALIVSVPTELVESVLHLNNFDFAGSKLSMEEIDGQISDRAGNSQRTAEPFHKGPRPNPFGGSKEHSLSQEATDVQTRMKSVLQRRYNEVLKLLDLSLLSSDQELNAMGVFDKEAATQAKVFAALMKVCDRAFETASAKREHVEAVSLTGNGLSDITPVTTLAPTFPSLKKLSLADNNIQTSDNIRNWRWKFRDLEVLDLSGNPISAEASFKETMMQWYPKLQILNNVPVRSAEEVTAKNKSPIPIMGPSFQDESQIGENFLTEFFPGFDNGRDLIVDRFYDAQSTFSLSVNNGSGSRRRDGPMSDFRSYLPRSRNLLKITHLPARVGRSYTGTQNIKQQWSILPKTRHPSLVQQSNQWLIECHPLPGLPDPNGQVMAGVGGLIIMVHGEFDEVNVATGTAQEKKSFDRTFVLGPGNGVGGIRVVSDILCVRPYYDGKDAFRPSDGPGGSVEPLSAEQMLKEELVAKMMQATGMNRDYALLCLEGNKWDPEEALKDFESKKAQLPPDAFVQL